ncbi:hypothetical protein CDD81_3847 [Ophiocordyceps australis]|uniref:Heparan-alpha-glucosaminide N-acetyltransferase catalytic domain-containing protein n=1 Tax=Ophiocordyceps australis TaxID=1399860 RepID=A0A2C5XVS3_9HYPO|nr:hypothetical protein CDD81_3847 [Ophiocordyceps australis]
MSPVTGDAHDSVSVPETEEQNQATSDHASSTTKPRGKRALAPDLLRGFLMPLMALDHLSVVFNTWPHGTGRVAEGDGVVVERFNFAVAYIVRTLTHLCAPGFTLLLGMGVVYLCQSRSRLGWSASRLAVYFVQRALALTAVMLVMSYLVTAGQIWLLNMILLALAVDYLVAGLLCLALIKTESLLTRQLVKFMPKSGEQQPLLARDPQGMRRRQTQLASAVSWHIHNAVLLALSVVTIAWNIWLSEGHGRCQPGLESAVSQDTAEAAFQSPENPLLRIWFWPVSTKVILSEFPPLAWLSFAILGLLYGRILTARAWNARALLVGQTLAGFLFALVFVATRLLRIGNLSEDCLHTSQQRLHPDANQYLVSPPSFFYIVKYPPDVAFWAMTVAANLFLLAGFGAMPARAVKSLGMLLDFGTSALFFYIVHFLLLLIMASVLVPLFGHDTGVPYPLDPNATRGIDNIAAYFTIWAIAMLTLWPLCRLYSRFKSRKPADSIWRFF